MKNFLQVLGFSLFVIFAFGGYSNFGIPQIKPAPPPVQEKLDLSSMTMDQFIALGDKIVNGKGTCTLCHNSLGRAPMLDKLGESVPKILADASYASETKEAGAYLYESMVEPSAFVVVGFGKAGSNDTESPMPDVSGGGIGLSDAEIKAVVAFLQDSNGMEVTVEIPTDMGAAEEEEEGESGEPRAPYATPEEAIANFGCGACHKVAGEEGEMGPDLTKIGALRDKDYLRRSLLDPNAEIADGFEADMMPPDLKDQMYASELEMMVNYLAGLK